MKPLTAMTSDRIKEIQSETAYPNSRSVKSALDQVWNECEQYFNSLHNSNQTTINTDYTEQPFNLETALKHPEWVITMDGREVDFIKAYDNKAEEYMLSVVLKDGRFFSYDKNGQFDRGTECQADLILRVPYVTKWLCLYSMNYTLHYTKEEAENSATEYVINIVPVKIPAI